MNYVITQVAKPQKNTLPQMQQKSVQNVDSAMNVYLENALVSDRKSTRLNSSHT